MFPILQSEIAERFRLIAEHYDLSPVSPADVAQTSRGLVFVEAYAVYEYTVRTSTRQAIIEIAAHQHKFKDIKTNLLVLFLNGEMSAVRDCGEKKIWEKRLNLVQTAYSGKTIAPVETKIHDGNYYRHTQLQMTFDVLGITRKITRLPRHKQTIDEVVNNRNSIAHGEETSAEVGRRYTDAEVKKVITTMRAVCSRLVTVLSEHCSLPDRHKR